MNKKTKIGILLGFVGVLGVVSIGMLLSTPKYKKPPITEISVPEWRTARTIQNTKYIPYKDEYDIVRNTDPLGGIAAKYYSKYLDFDAPNGKPIRILAQDEINDEQMLYAYDVLSFFINNLGTEVQNHIADSEEMLVLPNGADKDGSVPDEALIGQNLNQLEMPNVGSKWYIENDYEHRDASFEEIFHFVHDFGVGTVQNPGAMHDLTNRIEAAMRNALPANRKEWGKSGLWGYDNVEWLNEIEKEGSLAQEYVAAVIDSYYGLWEAWDETDGGMWGLYCAKNRAEMRQKDPMGYDLITSFLPENINQMFRIDPSFEGTFLMSLDETVPYTYKSQYLQNLSLTGDKDSEIVGNDSDNLFMGNSGNNHFDGGKGTNVVQFRGASSEYEISYDGDTIIVKDKISDRDGIDTLKNIQILRFTDKDI